MPLLAILSIIFSLGLFGCDEPPEKVTIVLCVIDAEANECICGTKKPNEPVNDLRREPMVYCEGATAFPTKSWEKYKNYVDGLEAFIERQRKRAEP